MKKMMVAAAAAALVAFSGCTTVDVSRKFNALSVGEGNKRPTTHISARMNGWYLFGFLPLFTGSARTPGCSAIFRDTVSVDNLVLLMTATARSNQGVRVLDLQTSESSSFVPMGLPLLEIRRVEGSCNAVGQSTPSY